MLFSGRIESVVDGVLRGWAWDETGHIERLAVSVLVDGRRIAVVLADRPRGDLRRRDIGDGCYGVECPLPIGLQDGCDHLFAFVVEGVGDTIEVARSNIRVERRSHQAYGKLERVEPHKVIGWIADRARVDQAVAVELLVEGRVVAKVEANIFRRDLLNAGIGAGAHGFVFDLTTLRPYPPAGSMIAVQAGVEYGHWMLGTAMMPSEPERRPIPLPAGVVDHTRNLLKEAREAEKQRDFSLAARLLDEGLSRARRDFDLLAIRARVALALNKPDDAARFAHAALAVRPGHVRPIVTLARVASARNNHEQAVALWAAIGPGEDNFRERLIKRGRSLAALGRPLEALAEFGTGVRNDALDRDAQRGMAEMAQAIGALRAAHRHWRRYAEIAPDDVATAARLREIEQRFPKPEVLPSPLRNSTLRKWPGEIESVAGAHPVEPTPWVTLRSLIDGGRVEFAVAERRELRPGELPAYGLLVRAADGAVEVAFALDAAAAPDLLGGLCMGVEVASESTSPFEVLLLAEAGPERLLARHVLVGRPRLLTFDLVLDKGEVAALERGRLWLAVRLGAPVAFRIWPPRPLCRLVRAGSAPGVFEDCALGNRIAKLGLGSPAPHAGAAIQRA
jgi:tetratricopeptide (TPR) repeat protein